MRKCFFAGFVCFVFIIEGRKYREMPFHPNLSKILPKLLKDFIFDSQDRQIPNLLSACFTILLLMKFPILFFGVVCILAETKSWSQQRFDIVIDEIMADPSPPVSLPNIEYVEIKNVSGKDLNLQGWKLTTSSSSSGAFANYILPADSFLILTTTGGAGSFTGNGRVLGIASFPALANEGTTLNLIGKDGKIIHFVKYNSRWYQNAIKEDGGWSLEMIDTHNPCSGQINWKASTDNSGGTPGKKNSIDGINKDDKSPVVKNIYARDNTTVVLQFDEAVDSANAVELTRYVSNPSISINSIAVSSSDFTEVQIKLNTPLTAATIYTISVSGIKDCAGNVTPATEVKLGLPQDAAPSDMVINEILFNPKPDGYDYVELYNRSNKIVDASKLYIGNRNSSGAISSLKKLSVQPVYVFPGSYLVLTEDANSLQKSYFVKSPGFLLEILSMPSFPDDKGTVVLTNFQGTIVDELNYLDDWHFALIADAEGVALERVDPDRPAQNADNWHSAASSAGYGTPTYKNSQYKQTDIINATIEITPKVFSPDNDGIDDIATIQFQINETGYVGNVTIFDVSGRMVRHLVKNATLGLKGSWNWDGLDEKGLKLLIGNYIIYTELFNLQGKKKQFKNVVVLARRLN